jgi:hypothetical protein
VADFLSEEWFEEINRSLAAAGPVPEATGTLYVVLEFTDAPAQAPHAVTFSLGEVASVAPGDHLAAETLLRLSYADAAALTQGTFDSATALRQGRVKVRGDLNALVPLLGWLQRAHPASA